MDTHIGTRSLEEVLANRAWLQRCEPFPHIVATKVFQDDFYAALAAQLGAILDRGLSEHPAPGRFSRNIPGYDAYGTGIGAEADGPLATFVSVPWRDMVCRLFDIEPTPYVFAGAHHHLPGSRTGFVHNDFNPVWFPVAKDGQLQTPAPQLCSYKTGAGALADAQKVEMVRGAVVIFFLLNDGWRPGDGGETGLFAKADAARPAAQWPPLNNSLVAFECTPRSFHAFQTNRRLPRSSIIMWVHRTAEDAARRHDTQFLERWR